VPRITGLPRLSGNGSPSKSSGTRRTRTHLSTEELEEFRLLLIAKRNELAGDVTHLESQAMGEGREGNPSSPMPIHMADLGSDTWEQELTLGLIENERGLLREIDEALDRVENKTFGICLATGKPIAKSRLRAKPWAKYCIEYARKRELGLV
jgi:RNA polymerase-binding protein DksA